MEVRKLQVHLDEMLRALTIDVLAFLTTNSLVLFSRFYQSHPE
jgi:hypothetical protein